MVLLFSPTSFLEVFIFLAAVAGFIFAIRFFVDSRKRLGEAFPDIFRSPKWLPFGVDRDGFLLPKKPKQQSADAPPIPRSQWQPQLARTKLKSPQRQVAQPSFGEALEQATLYDQKAGNNFSLTEQSKWEETNLEAKQNQLLAQSLQERLEAMQNAFANLQEKVSKMEKQAWQSAELTTQLEQAEVVQAQLETSVLKKEEQLQELVRANSELHELLDGMQEKLSHSNMQQQQLQKKLAFLENINADLQRTMEADKNVKARLNRVAELESMIELMAMKR